jgi:hypothetical protein
MIFIIFINILENYSFLSIGFVGAEPGWLSAVDMGC